MSTPTSICARCGCASYSHHGRFDFGDSPVVSLLGSNQSPSEIELQSIDHELSRSSNELELCEQEISHIETHLVALKQHRNSVSRYMEVHKAVTSPIRRVPVEILAMIIRQSVTLPLYIFNARLLRAHGAWLLALVCRSWRAVTLSIPELWSAFIIGDSTVAWSNGIHVTQTILQRSQPLPLKFLLELDSTKANSLSILNALCSHSDRWHDVTIHGTLRLIDSMSSIRGKLPQLSHLDISLTMQDAGITPTNSFAISPQLQTLRLRNCPAGHLELPWSQIRSFDCVGVTGVQILHQMTDLEALHLQYGGPPLDDHLHLPHLKSLRSFCRSGFLDCLTVPALEHASFKLHTINFHDFLSMVTRSSCTLTSLELSSTLSGPNLIALLGNLPFLETFRVQFVPPAQTMEFSKAMTMSPDQLTPLLPCLQTLGVQVLEIQDDLLAMIESRIRPHTEDGPQYSQHGTYIETIVLSHELVPDVKVAERLRNLSKRDIKLTFMQHL